MNGDPTVVRGALIIVLTGAALDGVQRHRAAATRRTGSLIAVKVIAHAGRLARECAHQRAAGARGLHSRPAGRECSVPSELGHHHPSHDDPGQLSAARNRLNRHDRCANRLVPEPAPDLERP